jgi:hypothetical protein
MPKKEKAMMMDHQLKANTKASWLIIINTKTNAKQIFKMQTMLMKLELLFY